MREFDTRRSDSIRAALITRVAHDVHQSQHRTPTTGAAAVHDRPAMRRGASWVAAAVGFILVGGLVGGILISSLGRQSDVATTTDSPSPILPSPETAIPTPTPTVTPDASPSPSDTAPIVTPPLEVTFTFDCWIVEEQPTWPDPPRLQFATMEEAWATDVPLQSCESIQHGTEYTDVQRLAVQRAQSVLPGGLAQLDSLYSQCAMRENAYLTIEGPLAENQAADVRGFLTLCPHHPAAAELQASLPQ